MKTFFRIFNYSKPIEKYAIPYFLCVLFHAIFNTMTFVLIIPVLTTLFDLDAMKQVVTEIPSFSFSEEYLEETIRYFVYKQFGAEYSIENVLTFLSIILVSNVFLSNIFRFASQKIMENFRIHTLQNLRDALFSNIMKLNVRFFSNERKGDILSKLTSDINVVQFCVTSTLQVVFKEPLLIVGYFIALVTISGKLTVFVLLMLPFTALIIGFIVKRLRKSAKEAQSSLGEMVSVAEEALSGVKAIKSYNAVDYIVSKFVTLDNKYSSIMRSMATRQQMASPMSEFLGISAVAVILIYGGGMVVRGELDASSFLAYIAAFSQVTRPTRAITDAFSMIHQGLAAGERVVELIDMKPSITDDNSEYTLEEFKDKIEFKNICFKYDDSERLILNNVSFSVNKGETVAIVGGSGGGKSTIAHLLPRFYDVTAGELLIDGVNIKDYKISSLRKVMSFVSQDITLFNDSIKNNILLGDTSSIEQVKEAAKIANADSFIEECADGYETNIGDSGVKLSGGQRQRLSIARAVLRNPQILILDEATSALDTESEKLVQLALDKLLQNRTSVVIAHRLSTIQHADKIIVVEDGAIVEQGGHDELILLGGVYKKLIDMQQL